MKRKWKELIVFSDSYRSLAMTEILHKEAVQKAARVFTNKKLQQFASHFEQTQLESCSGLISNHFINTFYLSILMCGQETGNLIESVEIGGDYLEKLMPLSDTLNRCVLFVIAAFLINAGVSYYYYQQIPLFMLIGLFVIFILPRLLPFCRLIQQSIFTFLPFIGTWCQQLAQMEFFSCMHICYNSSMSVEKMYALSANAISNDYLRRQAVKTISNIKPGTSMNDTLSQISFVSPGMSKALSTHEYAGKLETCFESFSTELRKVALAKVEIVKYATAAIVLSIGLFIPLADILKHVFHGMGTIIVLALGTMAGYSALASIRAAYENYTQKMAEVHLWWED